MLAAVCAQLSACLPVGSNNRRPQTAHCDQRNQYAIRRRPLGFAIKFCGRVRPWMGFLWPPFMADQTIAVLYDGQLSGL